MAQITNDQALLLLDDLVARAQQTVTDAPHDVLRAAIKEGLQEKLGITVREHGQPLHVRDCPGCLNPDTGVAYIESNLDSNNAWWDQFKCQNPVCMRSFGVQREPVATGTS